MISNTQNDLSIVKVQRYKQLPFLRFGAAVNRTQIISKLKAGGGGGSIGYTGYTYRNLPGGEARVGMCGEKINFPSPGKKTFKQEVQF